MKSNVIDRILMRTELKCRLEVSNQAAFILLITELGYRESKMWSEEEVQVFNKLCDLANQHTENQLELIEKYMNNFKVIRINEQGIPESIGYKFKDKWLEYNLKPEKA